MYNVILNYIKWVFYYIFCKRALLNEMDTVDK